MNWRQLNPHPTMVLHFSHLQGISRETFLDSHEDRGEECIALADGNGTVVEILRMKNLVDLHAMAQNRPGTAPPGTPDRAACLPGGKEVESRWRMQLEKNS